MVNKTQHQTSNDTLSQPSGVRTSNTMDDKRRLCARAMRLLGLGTRASPPLPSLDRVLDMSHFLQQNSVSQQEQSAFFRRLPLEIRLLIYSFVLPESKQVWARVTPSFVPRARASSTVDAVCIEHFPVRSPQTDLTWISESRGACCAAPSRGFFGRAQAYGMRPHDDALAMMKTCQRMQVPSQPPRAHGFPD